MATLPQSATARKTGQTTITTTARPLTQVGVTSGATTTFTAISVTDTVAWDLSAPSAGEVAVTSDGYKGIITAVDDGNDTLEIAGGWMAPSGRAPDPVTGVTPADGSTVTIHRVSRARTIAVQSLGANTASVYIGKDGDARATDKELGVGQTLMLASDQEEYLDVTRVYAIAAAGSQGVAYAGGGGTRRN